VEVDESSLQALRKAIGDDDVGATEAAMRLATDSWAPGGLAHQRKTWDALQRGAGHGIGHDETPYYDEEYEGGATYCGNLENDNDDGRHIEHSYTVLHHAVHCGSHRVIEWAISQGADVSLASSWKEASEDHQFKAALHALAADRASSMQG
jgi:hypothetical protein